MKIKGTIVAAFTLLSSTSWADFSFGNMFKEKKEPVIQPQVESNKSPASMIKEPRETHGSLKKSDNQTVLVQKDANETNSTVSQENPKTDTNSSERPDHKTITLKEYEEYLKLKAYAKEHNITF